MKKVFGIGLNKTGTKTLGKSMSILGYKNKSYDLSLLQNYSERNFNPIFHESELNDSFEDWPWPLMYKEFDTKYPDAQFILTYRTTPEVWYQSLCKHALRTGPTVAREIVYGFDMPQKNKQHHIDYYLTHNKNVIDYFKGRENKLLTMCFEDGDDWQKLCLFLQVSVPDLSFPHENSSKQM